MSRNTAPSPQPPAPPTPHPHAHAMEENAIPKDLPRPGPLTIIAVTLGLLVLIAAIYVVGWIPHNKQDEAAKADATSQADELPIVTVAPPRQSPANTDLFLPCDVRAFQETAIFPRTNGYLKKLYVDIQSKVTAGQLLAEIDSPEVDAELAQAQAALAQANAQLAQAHAAVDKSNALYALAKSTVERYRDLKKDGTDTVTVQELDEKENAYAQAQGDIAQSGANVHSAEANVVSAQATVDRFRTLQGFEKVLAPFDGVITARNYDVGALLSATDSSPGKEMFRIAEVDKLRVFVSVPQVYAGDIKVNGPAYLTVRNHPGTDFLGVVARTSASVDQATRTMLFELDFPNQDGRLFSGMYGTARLQLAQEHPTLLVPTAALRFDATGVHVAVVKDGKIYLRKVQTGRDLGTELEIIDGLSPDDQVVTNPAESIIDGSLVKVVDLSPKPPEPAPAPPRQASAN